MRPNIFYRLLILLLVLTLAMTLTACSNGDGDESGAESSTPTPNDQKPEYPEIDYLSLDLSQYVTLGQYKDITIGISKKPRSPTPIS